MLVRFIFFFLLLLPATHQLKFSEASFDYTRGPEQRAEQFQLLTTRWSPPPSPALGYHGGGTRPSRAGSQGAPRPTSAARRPPLPWGTIRGRATPRWTRRRPRGRRGPPRRAPREWGTPRAWRSGT